MAQNWLNNRCLGLGSPGAANDECTSQQQQQQQQQQAN